MVGWSVDLYVGRSYFPKRAGLVLLSEHCSIAALLYVCIRESVIVENIRLVDSTADFGVKTKLTPNCMLQERAKLVFTAVCTQ